MAVESRTSAVCDCRKSTLQHTVSGCCPCVLISGLHRKSPHLIHYALFRAFDFKLYARAQIHVLQQGLRDVSMMYAMNRRVPRRDWYTSCADGTCRAASVLAIMTRNGSPGESSREGMDLHYRLSGSPDQGCAHQRTGTPILYSPS